MRWKQAGLDHRFLGRIGNLLAALEPSLFNTITLTVMTRGRNSNLWNERSDCATFLRAIKTLGMGPICELAGMFRCRGRGHRGRTPSVCNLRGDERNGVPFS